MKKPENGIIPSQIKSEIIEDNIDKTITLKLEEESFARMIISILGSKQNIESKTEDVFVLSMNDICQFHHLLLAKIEKEQYTTINLFSITIQYNDNTKRTLNSIDSFNEFIETRNVVPVAINLTWNIVLDFPSSDCVEKQKIELMYNTKDNKDDGYITLNIEHTNQSWGIEVLNLLKSNINKTVINENKYSIKAKYVKKFFSSYIILFSFIISLFFNLPLDNSKFSREQYSILCKTNNQLINTVTNDRKLPYLFQTMIISNSLGDTESMKILQQIDTSKLSPEIKLIIEEFVKKYEVAPGLFSFYKFWLFPLSITTIFFIIHMYLKRVILFHKNKSFILLTSEAKNQYEQFKQNKSIAQLYSIGAIFFAILCGVIGNMIYNASIFRDVFSLLK